MLDIKQAKHNKICNDQVLQVISPFIRSLQLQPLLMAGVRCMKKTGTLTRVENIQHRDAADSLLRTLKKLTILTSELMLKKISTIPFLLAIVKWKQVVLIQLEE